MSCVSRFITALARNKRTNPAIKKLVRIHKDLVLNGRRWRGQTLFSTVESVLPVRNVMVFGTIETDAKWFSAASFRFTEQTRTRQRQISQNRTPKSQES